MRTGGIDLPATMKPDSVLIVWHCPRYVLAQLFPCLRRSVNRRAKRHLSLRAHDPNRALYLKPGRRHFVAHSHSAAVRSITSMRTGSTSKAERASRRPSTTQEFRPGRNNEGVPRRRERHGLRADRLFDGRRFRLLTYVDNLRESGDPAFTASSYGRQHRRTVLEQLQQPSISKQASRFASTTVRS